MTDDARPSRLLRSVAWIAKMALSLTLLAWLLVAGFWALLHAWVVPHIGDYKPQLEAQAAKWLGVPIHIADIKAHSVGLIPSFEVSGVQLDDAQGRPSLLLGRVLVALSPRSLLRLGFEQVSIEEPELDVRRLKDGSLSVAGIVLHSNTAQTDRRLEKWLYAQREVVIRNAKIHWTDEIRAAPRLSLSGVSLLLRNSTRQHMLRLDATPPEGWGQHVQFQAQFRQPLLSRNTGNWRDWDGRVFADLQQLNLQQLRQYVDLNALLGVDIRRATGAVRLWSDVQKGQPKNLTADIALPNLELAWIAPSTPTEVLRMRQLTGRLELARDVTNSAKGVMSTSYSVATQKLAFVSSDNHPWPGGNVALTITPDKDSGHLHADRLDLAALGKIAVQLPLNAELRRAIQDFAPQGIIEKIDANWQGKRYSAEAQVRQLSLAPGKPASSPDEQHPTLGRPGVQGISASVSLTQSEGRATLDMQNGSMTFPGLFDEPLVPFDKLQTELRWQISKDSLNVSFPKLEFANPDGAGAFQGSWHSATDKRASTDGHAPGVLDLQGSLSRVEATRVFRYLPRHLSVPLRNYLRAAVRQGTTKGVKVVVKGNLFDFPFADAKQGEFHIAAPFQNAIFAYVLPSSSPSPDGHWPALTEFSGELVLDRLSLRVRNASAKLEGGGGLTLQHSEAEVVNLYHDPQVAITIEGQGPLGDLLSAVDASPLAGWAQHALSDAKGTGSAAVQLKLQLPLYDLDKSKVQGSISLTDSDLVLIPQTPKLEHVKGSISFTENNFTLNNVQAFMLGGNTKLEGLNYASHATDIRVFTDLTNSAVLTGANQDPLGALSSTNNYFVRTSTVGTPGVFAAGVSIVINSSCGTNQVWARTGEMTLPSNVCGLTTPPSDVVRGAVSVISINAGSSLFTSVLGGATARSDIAFPFVQGWTRLQTPANGLARATNAVAPAPGAVAQSPGVPLGLPLLGSWYMKAVNGPQNFGVNFEHTYQRRPN